MRFSSEFKSGLSPIRQNFYIKMLTILDMKKNAFLLILFFITLFSYGEKSSYTIEWLFPTTVTNINGSTSYQVTFKEAIHTEKNHYLPELWININKDLESYNITNFTSEALNPAEASFVNTSLLSNEPSLSSTMLKNGSKISSRLTLIPLFLDENGTVQKIISFELNYQARVTNTIQQFRTAKTTATENSVLASGNWYKIPTSEKGVYKIDYNYLQSLGINPSGIDPKTFQIYGNGGGMLPQANNVSRPKDLIENTISIIGENDGSFDRGDYIIFYSDGADDINLDTTNGRLTHTKNLYSDEVYYFLTYGQNNGKRVSIGSQPNTPQETFNYTDALFYHETEKFNLLKSGRDWYGEDLTKGIVTINKAGINIPANTIISIRSKELIQSSIINATVQHTLNGKTLGTVSYGKSDTTPYGVKGVSKTSSYSINSNDISNNLLSFSLNLNNKGDNDIIAKLDYLEIQYRDLIKGDGFQEIISTESKAYNSVGFNLTNVTSTTTVWDISDIENITNYTINSNSFSLNNNGEIPHLISFNKALLKAPKQGTPIPNQNLRGVTDINELIIITHPDFMEQANKLADFKRDFNQYTVEVVDVRQIYNEFGSGKADITAIRDFIRNRYQKRTATDSVRFVQLIGDCSYDYKNNQFPGNFIPIYESRQSLNDVRTYSSDDYFAFMDDNEGEWNENESNHIMDLAVGRFPVQTPEQAELIVDKVINYSENLATFGKWRNNLCFVADDDDNNMHTEASDVVSSTAERESPSMNIKKLFVDSYQNISSPGGETAPELNDAIVRTIEEGVLLINYTGHGSEVRWTGESILDKSTINKLRNYNKLPFFITATCEFGRYDDPSISSGGERILLSEKGGGIGALTTTRPVYASSNLVINNAFFNYVFKANPDGSRPSIGEVMRNTKNASISGINNRNFSLLGDASIVLAYPKHQITITDINNNGVNVSNPDTLKALSEISVSGEIRDLNNNHINNFNGKAFISIFDKKSEKKTLGQGKNPVYSYTIQENKLFNGQASVKDGEFSFKFVVPKDISYNYDFGKISMYATENNDPIDAGGYNTNLIIGGVDENAPLDTTAPKIRLYMDTTTFISGDKVNPNTTLIVKLSDENGINTSSTGIGHEITATLDKKTSKTEVLNQYYTSDEDTYKSGYLRYDYKDLTPGLHTITVKAWDSHNNSNESNIFFYVNDLALEAHNYPNPFSEQTDFFIKQNRFNDNVDIEIVIYNSQGQHVRLIKDSVTGIDYTILNFSWNGKDDNSTKVRSGLYFFKVNLRYQSDGKEISKIGKLLLIN